MKEMRFILLLVAGIVAGLLILHYARPVSTPPSRQVENPQDTGSSQAAGPIAAVDFRNFSYRPGCLGQSDTDRKSLETRNGRYEFDAETDKLFFTVISVTYGDLTGDGQPEAAVLTTCNTGGSGSFSEGIIYGIKDGKPVELARTAMGDRAYGGIQGLKIRDGRLQVERFATDEGGPMCCPKYIDSLQYRLDGHKLEQDGAAARRDVTPSP